MRRLREVYPSATEQRCWNHRMVNVLDRTKPKDQETGNRLLRQRVYADHRQDADQAKRTFQGWCQTQGYGQAAAMLDEDGGRRVTFDAFPKAHWAIGGRPTRSSRPWPPCGCVPRRPNASRKLRTPPSWCGSCC
ncbi:MAG: transposase [Armatimonadetes bacterium]|nr:transposase [Armatimonadota bacterium]